jgi:hypothetical protein
MSDKTFTSADNAYDFLTANGINDAALALTYGEAAVIDATVAEYISEWVHPAVDQANENISIAAASGDDTGDVDAYEYPTDAECRIHIQMALDILADEIADDYGDN